MFTEVRIFMYLYVTHLPLVSSRYLRPTCEQIISDLIFLSSIFFLFSIRFPFYFAGLLSCRQVLNIMVILGFMLNYALRVNLTIAIVAMVEDPTAKSTTISNMNFNATALHANETTSTLAESVSFRIFLNKPHECDRKKNLIFDSLFFFVHLWQHTAPEPESGRFKWDAVTKNTILGSFFLGYILTELPGGRLAEVIGGHRVFGHSMLWASVLTMFTPVASFIDYKALVVVRALLGLMLGKCKVYIR